MPEYDDDQSSKIDFLNENFNNRYWNQVIFHCIKNDDFLGKVVKIIPLDTFKSREKKYIMKMLYDFYYDFKISPKDNFYDLFKEHEKTMSEELYDQCMALIKTLKSITGSNHEYILSRLSDALRHFYLEEASVEFASLIKRKKYDDAKMTILAAMKKSEIEEQEEYYDYFSDKSYIFKRLNETKYKMKTKIEELDKFVGGFNPPWLITILAGTKVGKSWALLELSVSALLQGLNVLFVSLEMNKEIIDGRLDQITGFMSSKDTDSTQETMEYKRGKWAKVNDNVKSIYDINEVEKNRKRIKKIGGGSLKVIAFNRGRMNYMDIERVLNEAELNDGFIADVLVVDYLGLMRETSSGQSKKDRIGENCLGLKEICGKRNIIGITAMQGNRKALMAKVFHSHMIADDIDTIFNSDLILTMCQTKKEEKENSYRLYCANFRHGKQHWTIRIIRDLTIGQIALDSMPCDDYEDVEDESKVESY